MHALLDEQSRRRYPLAAFRKAYEDAAGTATATAARVGEPRGRERRPPAHPGRGGHPDLRRGARPGGAADRRLRRGLAARPGVPRPQRGRAADPPHRGAAAGGDRLGRQQGAGRGPRPGPQLARGRRVLDRRHASSPATTVPSSDAVYARGFPRDTPVGRSGLERALQTQVEGFPGGTLLAGAGCSPARGRARPRRVRSTIDSRLQESAVEALAGRLGGIAALDPRTRRGARPGGHRLLGPPAAGIDVQDHDHRRGAGEEARSSSATSSRSRPRP